jgi:deoxyribose-phosphate aldolase
VLNEVAVARRALGLVDLTRLGAAETAADMGSLCERAMTACGPVAAVCVWPQFVSQCRSALAGTGIRVAAVANFPDGGSDAEVAVLQTRTIVADGADEVDLVMAYHAWLEGRRDLSRKLIAHCKVACGPGVVLKVILETGVLATPEAVREASLDAIDSGADFIKTSTGKTSVSATPEAAAIMLRAIRDRGAEVGFKAAGGIRELAQAAEYLSLADEIMGRDWACPARFRFGASGLLDALLNVIEGCDENEPKDDY